MRFTNVDQDPEPCDLAIRYSPPECALRVPHRDHPQVSVAQEPSIVRLPDNRLFCVMRTCSGYIWWSQSRDDGENWHAPRPLLYRDHGRPLLNPVAPDPIYPLTDVGGYAIFFHNNRGGAVVGGFNDSMPRNPVYMSLGGFRPHADQPVWFSEPKLLLDTQGIGIDGVQGGIDPRLPGHSGHMSMYASFTNRNGMDVLWYPDSKSFLLGRRITPNLLADLRVPEA